MCNSHQRRKRDLAQMSAIFQGISGFWDKVVTFLLLLGVCCSGGGGGGAEAGAGGWVGTRAQDGCWWTQKEDVVLGNWQAPKAQLSKVQAGPHL